MLGILNNDQIDVVLQTAMVGRIGCSSIDKIFIIPVTYVYDNGYIYAHSKEGTKVQLMRQNPKVCFQVDAIENMCNWRSVIVWGSYEELKNEKEQQAAMSKLTSRLMPFITSDTVHPFQGRQTGEQIEKGYKAVAYRIKVEEKTGRYEKSSKF